MAATWKYFLFVMMGYIPGTHPLMSCTKPATTPNPNGPYPPVMTYHSFETNVQANIMDAGRTYTIEALQAIDGYGNNGLLKTMSHGTQTTLIFSYNTNEIFSIDTIGHCHVIPLNTSQSMEVFGDLMRDGNNQIPNAGEVLRFTPQTNPPAFMGYRSIGGVLTTHWRTCDYWSPKNLNLTLDHYFTAANWSTSSSDPHVPARIEVQGLQTFSNGSTRQLHHIYNYYNFRKMSQMNPQVFETPRGVACPGRLNTKQIPSLPNTYSYRTEIVHAGQNSIQEGDVWYWKEQKIMRYDYRLLTNAPPLYTLNPITEIHDFNYGVRYLRDNVKGNCSVFPMVNGSFDDTVSSQAFKKNGSYVLHMKDPAQFFNLDKTYAYSGQRSLHGILCDVYTKIQPGFLLPGIPDTVNMTFEYYFVAEGTTEFSNMGVSTESGYPYRLDVFNNDVGFNVIYTFVDWNTNAPSMSVFDISDCFPDTGKLSFTVRYGASRRMSRDKESLFTENARFIYASVMTVAPIRLQKFSIDYDASNVYVHTTLLDRTPSYAQFTMLPFAEMEKSGNVSYPNVTGVYACADLCVKNQGIACKSFDYCPNDNSYCRLSAFHIADGYRVKASQCNHFSRSVDPKSQHELSIGEAYGTLQEQVFERLVEVDVQEDDYSTTAYIAVDVSVTFGYTIMIQCKQTERNAGWGTKRRLALGWTSTKPIPGLSEQYSFHEEVVYPAKQLVIESDVWYDNTYKLARFDYRDPTAGPPYYTPYTMSYIHDFNTGIAYAIDKTRGNCTVTTIPVSVDDEKDKAAAQKNGAYILKMKGPLEMLGLNYQFRYAGERTVRGILCDVFETTVPSYHIPLMNVTTTVNLQYFFQSSSWKLIADPSSDVTRSQPVMARMTASKIGFFTTAHISNFNDQGSQMSAYDISNCFSDTQRHRFMITFNQHYHPYLDSQEDLFKRQVIQMMSDYSHASLIRFQDPRVSYNLDNVYMTVTLLGEADYILHFTKLHGVHPPHTVAKTYNNIATVDGCAKACITDQTIICNSFDFCPSSKTCLLNTLHVDSGGLRVNTQMCTHYSRTVNGTIMEPPLMHVFDTIKDLVYKRIIQFNIPYGHEQVKTFVATGIRDDIMETVPPSTTEGEYLSKFTVYHNNVIYMHNDYILHKTAVDDCATACFMQSRFDCQSFDYCYTTGDCLMSRLHPADNTSLVMTHAYCDMYAKKYILDFTEYPGKVLLSPDDKTLANTASPDNCARSCSTNINFDCKSFDYCPSLKSCRLRKQHILEVPDTSITTSAICNHYSRNYVYDFAMTQRSVISGHDDIIISGITKGACAKACVEQSSIQCKSFEFCGNGTGDCRLSTAHPTNHQVVVQKSEYCDLYSRSTVKGVSPYGPNSNPQNGGSGNDSGVKAGLAIGMLFLGVVLGAAVLFVIIRFGPKRLVDEDKMHIVMEEVKE